MSRLRSAAALAAVVGLVGCATHGKFVAKMNMLVGKPEAVVVGMYGPPSSSYQLADGSKVIQYAKHGSMTIPGVQTTQPVTTTTTGNVTVNQGLRTGTGYYNQTSTTYVPQTSPPITVQLSCTVNFTIDPTGKVAAWTSQGNNCVSEG